MKRLIEIQNELRKANVSPAAITVFSAHYTQLINGDSGLLLQDQIESVETLPNSEELSDLDREIGLKNLSRAVILKLNGGLGTSMGMTGPKSLLQIKNSETFLDLIAKQAISARVPLVLMNSFATQKASLAALAKHEKLAEINGDLPYDFLQHKIPKLDQETLLPVQNCESKHKWCPPGHGDLYTALVSSGLLKALLQANRRFAFISNADNLGGFLDPKLLGAFISSKKPLLLEVTDRTFADRKGGHLARKKGRLILRERAQCPSEEIDSFQDINRYRYFNTNNLWLDLKALQEYVSNHGPVILPMIRNAKTADPRDPTSQPVYQLESAMGSAIGVFDGAGAIRVPRSRFSPVKTTADLLAVRSDAYIKLPDHRVILAASRNDKPPIISLDPAFFAHIHQLERQIPVIPSLLYCDQLRIKGDVRFKKHVSIKGIVTINSPQNKTTWIHENV